MSDKEQLLIALAGQPNCGKSTVFNMLTGAHQHVANYPGVTVEKKSGVFHSGDTRIDLVDLPGTYSLTSYSLEERVARDFLLQEKPDLCINVADVSTLRRGLYLTLQLMEMECPLILVLNMMDKARKEGVVIDLQKLEDRLGIGVVGASAAKGEGKTDIEKAIRASAQQPRPMAQVNYGPLEEAIENISQWMHAEGINLQRPERWLILKLLEGDEYVREYVQKELPQGEALLAQTDEQAQLFETAHKETVSKHIAICRYALADDIVRSSQEKNFGSKSLTNTIDGIVCHKILGPAILVGIIYLLYQLSIVYGYELTNYTWPLLAKFKSLVASVMPAAGFVEDPLTRSLSLWIVDSVNALLNYIPIFLILFGLISILEDSGYMPRMAFILDRMLQRFGLHGQSTLPLVLGGVYVGGCAVPAIMSSKAVPDHRARLATILIIPLLNCLAKVPLYILLISTYFADHKGMAMFFISTISLLMALPVAKILTMTLLRGQESAPFIMEMPDYHLPTIGGVLRPALQKVWLFVKKITSIVAAVAIVVFALLRFPGVGEEAMCNFEARADQAINSFMATVEQSPVAENFSRDDVLPLLEFANDYKQAKIQAKSDADAASVEEDFSQKNAVFLSMVKGQPRETMGKISREVRKLARNRKILRMEVQKERINRSFLGRIGKAMEPVTQWAGFTWRVNVALLSALAAKENTVATLGALYQEEHTDGAQDLSQSMRKGEAEFTALHALALMLFMVLYPPCLATLITIKLQTGSYKYLFFSLFYQIALGSTVAILVFTGGRILGLNGFQAMIVFYILALLVAIGVGALPNPPLSSKDAQAHQH